MKPFRFKAAGLVALLAGGLAACSADDGLTGNLNEDPMSAEQAGVVSEAVAQAAVEGLDVGLGSILNGSPAVVAEPGVANAVADMLTVNFTHVRDCANVGEGTITVEGTLEAEFDRETHSGSSNLNATIVAANCVVMHREAAITINTIDPHIAKVGSFTFEERRKMGELTIQGAFTWFIDEGNQGMCTIDVTITLTGEGRSKSGTVCGFDVGDRDRHGDDDDDDDGDDGDEGDDGDGGDDGDDGDGGDGGDGGGE